MIVYIMVTHTKYRSHTLDTIAQRVFSLQSWIKCKVLLQTSTCLLDVFKERDFDIDLSTDEDSVLSVKHVWNYTCMRTQFNSSLRTALVCGEHSW